MKNRSSASLLGGVLLILAGIIFLLDNLGFVNLESLWEGVWALIFLAGGAAFLFVFVQNTEQWWALIPGFSLLGIGGQIAIAMSSLRFLDFLDGAIVLGGISLGFLVVYALQREQWWALIPGGILASLAAMILFENLWPGPEWVIVMFFGMAATFALVGLMKTKAGVRMTWAFIPAGVLFLIGLLVFGPSFGVTNLLFGLALIGVGGYLLLRTVVAK